jgi:hypothetical protein
MASTGSSIYPSLSELIDRLSVDQIKEVLVSHGRGSFNDDIQRIEAELDTIFSHMDHPVVTSRFIRLVIALSQINLHIWKEKECMMNDRSGFEMHLKLSHQLNGLRNQLKNELLEETGIRERSLAKTNTNTEDLEGWTLSVLRREKPDGPSCASGDASASGNQRYAYLLTDFIDTLAIHQIKEVFFRGEKKNAITVEIEQIARDVDARLRGKGMRPTGRLIGLLVLLAQANLHVWMNKDLMLSEPERYNELLNFAQDINGLRNHVRNIMMEDLSESAPCNVKATFLSGGSQTWYHHILGRLKITAEEPKEALYAITGDDLMLYFGIEEKDLSAGCREILESRDFRYKRLEGSERDEVIRRIIIRIESGELWVSGEDKKHVWEKGWSENLEEYEKTKDVFNLMPKFLQAKKVLRLGRGYIEPANQNFEFDIIDIYRRWVFQKYLSDVQAVYEFGCGSCQHLPVLVELFPDKEIHGLDWADASKKIIDTLVHDKGWKIKGHTFNLFSPDYSLSLSKDSGVITLGTMEQTGKNFEPFLQFLLSKGPNIVCHIESMMELYDENNLCDCLAKIYDRKRNYLDGYLNRLRALEKERRIDIIEMRRVYFGSMFHDSYSLAVWRPRP